MELSSFSFLDHESQHPQPGPVPSVLGQCLLCTGRPQSGGGDPEDSHFTEQRTACENTWRRIQLQPPVPPADPPLPVLELLWPTVSLAVLFVLGWNLHPGTDSCVQEEPKPPPLQVCL